MKANLLHYTWKGITGYSYAFIMITHRLGLEDVRKTKKKIVLWGGLPDTFAARCALEKAGISVNLICDFGWLQNMKSAIMEIRNWKQLLDEPEKYFFIIAVKAPFERMEIMKRLAYAGVDEYGVVFEGYTKDFQNKKVLQSAVLSQLMKYLVV